MMQQVEEMQKKFKEKEFQSLEWLQNDIFEFHRN